VPSPRRQTACLNKLAQHAVTQQMSHAAGRQWLAEYAGWQQAGPLAARPGDGDTPRERDAKAQKRLAAELASPAVPERVNGKCAWCREPMPFRVGARAAAGRNGSALPRASNLTTDGPRTPSATRTLRRGRWSVGASTRPGARERSGTTSSLSPWQLIQKIYCQLRSIVVGTAEIATQDEIRRMSSLRFAVAVRYGWGGSQISCGHPVNAARLIPDSPVPLAAIPDPHVERSSWPPGGRQRRDAGHPTEPDRVGRRHLGS
jgi:hypothetical protein